MIRYVYLAIILLSFAFVVGWDLRTGSRFISRPQVWLAIGCSATFLLLADIIGIRLGIFMTNSQYVSDIFLGARNFPLEEPPLLLFISYFHLG